jgi:hypothetical protein
VAWKRIAVTRVVRIRRAEERTKRRMPILVALVAWEVLVVLDVDGEVS